VCFFENGAAGGLVDTTTLHTDKAVLHQIDAANAVFATQFVEFGKQVGRRETLTVDGDSIAFFELDLDVLRLIRGACSTPFFLILITPPMPCSIPVTQISIWIITWPILSAKHSALREQGKKINPATKRHIEKYENIRGIYGRGD